ncbi:PREDICTED: uncharacterized protein LOC109115570 [Nelumbo nucifera]|uniref:Uncharacterized protein LOC109115570 n=1 Tax=Nelumbo nucifera TaxID=4432 RepID=A0A1U8QB87_NELNU|nr:PREDICTED: uncharacterized protein LOC109115570 [Nelumbo nucifera]
MALDWGIDELEIYGDSFLVISQAKGDWEVRVERLALYHNCLKELIKKFECISFNYLPREDNRFADALASLGSAMCLLANMAIEPIDLNWDSEPVYISSILAVTIEDEESDVKTSTRATPYSLVYGMEAVLPTEVEVPSLCVILELEIPETNWVQECYEQLEFLDEAH